jgi:chromate transporter
MRNSYSLSRLILYFLKIGTTGFGGSIALAHIMQKDLVEKRRWLTHEQFLRGLALSQIAPGPLAGQLAMYIGYVKAGILGATVSAIAFILPSFFLVLGISILYSFFGNISLIQSILYGINAGVVGIIASSGYSLTRTLMKRKMLIWAIYFVTFFIIIYARSTSVFIFIGAGLFALAILPKEKVRVPQGFALFPYLISNSSLALILAQPIIQLFLFFLLAGSIAFGGGFAIIPFLQHGAVVDYHWLTNKQFIDAIGVAMITPGPVMITSTFIGYLVAGFPGALVATVAVFLPVYLIVVLLTPLFTRHAERPQVQAFVEGVTAAAMAAIAGTVLFLGLESIKDFYTLFIAFASLLAMKFWRVPGVLIIIVAGLLGLLLKAQGA